MIQSGRRSRLEHEAVYCIGMKYSPPRQELQDQIATELGITSLVELTHSTRTEEADDLVFADRGPGGHGLGGVHRTKNMLRRQFGHVVCDFEPRTEDCAVSGPTAIDDRRLSEDGGPNRNSGFEPRSARRTRSQQEPA